MAAYNFMAFAGMLGASGVYWLLSGPLGFSARTIFLVGGILTVPVTISIVRLLPFDTARLAVQLLVNCMYRVRVEGVENVPQGGALVVANHISWSDGVLLGLTCPRHPRMVAFAPYFDNPWLGWFGRVGRIIPIGTTRKSMAESIRLAREALQNGELVCIFPEGGITRNGEMQEFRPGFLSILKDTGARWCPLTLADCGEAYSATRAASVSGNGRAIGAAECRSASAGRSGSRRALMKCAGLWRN